MNEVETIEVRRTQRSPEKSSSWFQVLFLLMTVCRWCGNLCSNNSLREGWLSILTCIEQSALMGD